MIARKTVWMLAAGICLTLAISSGMFLVMKPENKASDLSDHARVVKLVKLGVETSDKGISYPGRIKPVRHAELFFRVSGPVMERNLKYGQTVEEGDVLMRIDPRDYQREVDRLTQELEMQKVQNTLANIEFRRNKTLLETSAVSQAVYDSAVTKKQSSDAQVKMLEVSLKIAQDKLKDTVLYAPFHGTISDLKIEQYEIAAANVPVVTLDDLRIVEIKVSVPAGNLPNTNLYDAKQFVGLRFDVTFPGRGNRVVKAAIYEFKPIAAEESETYEVTLRMKVPDDFLILPGMSVEVHGLPHYQPKEAHRLIVPFASVVKRNGQDIVWRYLPKNGRLEAVPVKVGKIADGNAVTVEGDLKPGDYLVAAGGDWVTETMNIRILNPEVFHENR